jgi:hypothetical protein
MGSSIRDTNRCSKSQALERNRFAQSAEAKLVQSNLDDVKMIYSRFLETADKTMRTKTAPSLDLDKHPEDETKRLMSIERIV